MAIPYPEYNPLFFAILETPVLDIPPNVWTPVFAFGPEATPAGASLIGVSTTIEVIGGVQGISIRYTGDYPSSEFVLSEEPGIVPFSYVFPDNRPARPEAFLQMEILKTGVPGTINVLTGNIWGAKFGPVQSAQRGNF